MGLYESCDLKLKRPSVSRRVIHVVSVMRSWLIGSSQSASSSLVKMIVGPKQLY